MSEKSEIDLLYEAADIAGFDASKGWPDELEWQQLIALMVGHEWLPPLGAPRPVTIEYPDGRVEQIGYSPNLASFESEERRLQRKACSIILKMLRDAGLKISERIESIPQPPKMVLSLGPARMVPKEQPPEIRRTFVVTRQAVRSCLLSLHKDPSEFVSAWLGDRLRNETVVERNRRIAAAVLDGEMTRAQAEAEGVKPDNLKRILSAERKRRRAAAQDRKASPSDKTANPMQDWAQHTITIRPQTGIAKPSPKKKTILSKM